MVHGVGVGHWAIHRRLPLEEMARLLSSEVDINAAIDTYGTALTVATFHERMDIVSLVLDQGADINAVGGEYGSALAAGACEGNARTLEIERIKKKKKIPFMRTLCMPNLHIHRCLHDCHALIVWVELLSFPTLQNYSLSLSYRITMKYPLSYQYLSIISQKRFQKCNLRPPLSCVPSSYVLAKTPFEYTVYMSHSIYTFTKHLSLPSARSRNLFRTTSVLHFALTLC